MNIEWVIFHPTFHPSKIFSFPMAMRLSAHPPSSILIGDCIPKWRSTRVAKRFADERLAGNGGNHEYVENTRS
ncbi:MAG: hypothetical protein KGJ79_16805 [Alphaproteobacteria bacterium]|nr:hypothetical protein [Alphaproteobacteria bacterium]